MTDKYNTLEINGYYIKKLEKSSLPLDLQQLLNTPPYIDIVAYSIVKKEYENDISQVKFAYGTTKEEAISMLESLKIFDDFTMNEILKNINKLD